MELSVGKLVRENLRLVRLLGEGAMGSVWVAEHLGLHVEVAVKFVRAELAQQEPMVRARFTREATAAAQIKSPHVVQIFDNGVTADGTPFIVMELLEGETLGNHLHRAGRLGVRECGELVAQVARALDKAHQLGIVHRDIKPDNVFMVQSDDGLLAKVLDFGIAKNSVWSEAGLATNPDSLVGTPAYMSRERIMAHGPVDAQADLWALAACAYECLTGRLPFAGTSMGLICVAICQGRYRPASELRPRLGPHTDEFFARAFHQDPQQRYATAGELAHALLVATTTAPGELRDIEAALHHSGEFRMPAAALARASRPSMEAQGAAANSWTGTGQVATAEPLALGSQPGDDPAAPAPGGERERPATFSGTASLSRVFGVKRRWPRAAVASVVVMASLATIMLIALLWPAARGSDPAADPAATTGAASALPSPISRPADTASAAAAASDAGVALPAADGSSVSVPPSASPAVSPSASPPTPGEAPRRAQRPEEVLGI